MSSASEAFRHGRLWSLLDMLEVSASAFNRIVEWIAHNLKLVSDS
jgi:hypothetical protein